MTAPRDTEPTRVAAATAAQATPGATTATATATETQTETETASAKGKGAAAGKKRSKRWLRVAVPFFVLFVLITGTLIVHAIELPDPDDPDYLSPASSAAVGSSQLAAGLRARGVTVQRVTSTAAARTAMLERPSTLFVTTPDLVEMDRFDRFASLLPGSWIVAVTPSQQALTRADWPVEVIGERWTAAVAEPGCADGMASAAGTAAVRKVSYGSGEVVCYDNGMVTTSVRGATVTVVGASDPFRNDRFAENHNAALAIGLLSRTDRVVWLDVHEREKPPVPIPPTFDDQDADDQAGGGGDRGRGDTGGQGDGEPGQGDGDGTEGQGADLPNPLAEAFPPALWATLVLLAIALIALAAAAARRLGNPVAEPLPSRVPALETLLGHGRLYQRARARGPSLDILREAARRRLADHLGLPADAGPEHIAEAAGLVEDDVRDILAGDEPENDDELVAGAAAVRSLEREIKGEQS